MLAAATILTLLCIQPERAVAGPVLPSAYNIASVSVDTIGDLDPNTNRVTENDMGIGLPNGPGSQGLTEYGTGNVAQPGLASAALSIVYGPAPAAMASANSGVTGVANPTEKPSPVLPYGGYGSYEGDANANIHYSIEFFGPKPKVLVDIAAVMQISNSGYGTGSVGSASAGINITDGPYDDNDFLDALFLDGLTRQTTLEIIRNGVGSRTAVSFNAYTETGSYLFNTGEVYDVGISASADALTLGSATGVNGAASAFASIDPVFTIDPSNPEADADQILISNGIGNSAPSGPTSTTNIPEPPIVALLFGGLACTSIGSRRLRRWRGTMPAPSTLV